MVSNYVRAKLNTTGVQRTHSEAPNVRRGNHGRRPALTELAALVALVALGGLVNACRDGARDIESSASGVDASHVSDAREAQPNERLQAPTLTDALATPPAHEGDTSTTFDWTSPWATGAPPCATPEVADAWSVEADVSDWRIYESSLDGFSIRYPPAWSFELEEAESAADAENLPAETVRFRPPELVTDWLWSVTVRNDGAEWARRAISGQAPSFGGNRYWLREPVVIDGVEGERTRLLTCADEGWLAETVVLSRGSRTYLISGTPDVTFERFYGSLELQP